MRFTMRYQASESCVKPDTISKGLSNAVGGDASMANSGS